MIFGIGTDIVDMKRVKSIWKRFGKNFANRILMSEEMDLFKNSKDPARFLAMRFAGKEATVKAMGTGFSNGVWLKDVGIVTKKGGHIILLYKPQFEAGRQNISKNGLVKKEIDPQKLLSDFVNSIDKSNLDYVESKNSYIRGKKGNQEIFVHLKKR